MHVRKKGLHSLGITRFLMVWSSVEKTVYWRLVRLVNTLCIHTRTHTAHTPTPTQRSHPHIIDIPVRYTHRTETYTNHTKHTYATHQTHTKFHFLSVCLSVYLPACLPACMSLCLSACLSENRKLVHHSMKILYKF